MKPPLSIRHAVIKSARVDMVKGNLDITISVTVTDELLVMRKDLAFLSWDKAPVLVEITDEERQPILPGIEPEGALA